MKCLKSQPSFQDARGVITDIVEGQQFNAATIITSKQGAVRGNHVHHHTLQIIYLLSGRVLYRTRLPSGEVVDSQLSPGDMLITEPFEEHAMKALEDATFLVLTNGPRQGAQYASDTFQIDSPLIEIA